jgi:phosphoglucosamine mutase
LQLEKGKKASIYFDKFKKTPQILENIEVKNKDVINHQRYKKIYKNCRKINKRSGTNIG